MSHVVRECLDLETGKIVEVHMKYTAVQEQRNINRHRFIHDGIAFDGYCRKCKKPVLMNDGHYQTNVDGKGNVITDCYHRGCL